MSLNLSKVESYTQTINTLRSSLNLDYELDKKILDILPKLIEARARYWTKGEHGYFTGSYSDGKSGGTPNCSGGIGVISDNGAKLSTAGQKVLTNGGEGGIIEFEENGTAVSSVHYIGKINIDIYKCVTENIQTDEVIITDERIRHIQERHPNDFEMYCKYMREIVETPDYIIEANKPHTALVLREFNNGNENFKTVLRLVIPSDNPIFKNSIITFMKIDEKEWNRLIKNKKILYKNE